MHSAQKSVVKHSKVHYRTMWFSTVQWKKMALINYIDYCAAGKFSNGGLFNVKARFESEEKPKKNSLFLGALRSAWILPSDIGNREFLIFFKAWKRSTPRSLHHRRPPTPRCLPKFQLPATEELYVLHEGASIPVIYFIGGWTSTVLVKTQCGKSRGTVHL